MSVPRLLSVTDSQPDSTAPVSRQHMDRTFPLPVPNAHHEREKYRRGLCHYLDASLGCLPTVLPKQLQDRRKS